MIVALNLLCSPSTLKFAEGETVLYRSNVEVRSLRRRASRLLPIPVAPTKPKIRELVLTNRRLFCLKRSEKAPQDLTIKTEILLRTEKPKDKESRNMISTVELKGEREFVVLTVSLVSQTVILILIPFRRRRITITPHKMRDLLLLGFRRLTLLSRTTS